MVFSKKKIIIFICSLGAFCLVTYFLAGFLASCCLSADKIKKIVKENSGLTVCFSNTKVRTLPDLTISITADNFSISMPDEQENILSTARCNLRIAILPLLFKNISVSKFSSDDFKLIIQRDRDGVFDFEKFISNEIKFPLKLRFKKANVQINNINVSFLDKKFDKKLEYVSDALLFSASDNPKKLEINTKGILKTCALDSLNCHDTNVAFYFDSRLPINKYLDYKDTNFDIDIRNINLAPYLPYFNEFSGNIFNNLSAKANLSFKKNQDRTNANYLFNVELSDVLANFNYNGKKNIISLPATTSLSLPFIAQKRELLIKPSDVLSHDINLNFSGLVKNYKTKNPKPDINLKITNSEFMSFIRIIPASFVVYKTDIINELLKANPYAKLNGEINISGNYKKPDINGDIKVDDLYLFTRPKNFDTASVDCNFDGDIVNVNVYVAGPNNQFVKVKGHSEIYGKQTGEYDVVSSDSVDLAFAHKYLIPVQRVIGFKLGPLPFMKISGNGKIHIKTSGTIYDAVVYGKFKAKNITASMDGLNTVLRNGKIELDFNGKIINIVNTSADMSGGVFELRGFADDYNNLDVKTQITNVTATDILNIAKTSTLIKTYSGDLSFIKQAKGDLNLSIVFKGKAKSLEGLDFIKYIKPTGEIILKNVSATILPNYNFSNIKGKIAFSDTFNVDIVTKFSGADSYLKGSITPNESDLTKSSAKFKLNLNLGVKMLSYSRLLNIIKEQHYFSNNDLKFLLTNAPLNKIDFLFNAFGMVKGEIPANFKKQDYSKVKLYGNFEPINSDVSKNIKFIDGKYSADGSKIIISNSHVKFFDSDVYADGHINDFIRNPQLNLKLSANNFSFGNVQNFVNNSDIKLFRILLSDFVDYKGYLDFNLNIKKNFPYGKIKFNNISMFNKKQQIPLILKSGAIKFTGEKIFVDAFNFNYGNTPIYFNATARDYLSKKPLFNAMFSTNIDESSADKLINPYLTYPFKVKGEIRLKGRIKGDFNNYSLISYLTLPRGTDITYMGANFGDIQYDREFEANANFAKNSAKINNASYVMFIPSQNNKPTPVTMLKAYGNLISNGKNLSFSNFRIFTPNAVTAKVFNVIFKKSVLKQGLFKCDLNLNGSVLLPHATGKINFRNINIPLYSTKINDLDCDISKRKIIATIKGKSFDSDVEIFANIQNKQTLPVIVENLNIMSKKTSLSQLIEGISQLPKGSSDIVPGQPIILKPKDLLILDGHASADEIELYNIKASNLKMHFSNPTGDMLNINDMSFDIAGGNIKSSGNFDVSSMLFDIDSVVNDCDANTLSENFLGLQNQIYGRTNAKIKLKGKIPENAQDIKLVSGNVNFSVNNGKMPKLGSLEYLLRAGNLIKSGILGLTLNNLIEVLMPYKTGEFSAIKGSFELGAGKISSLEIFSKGNNLSLFIYGNYDIINDDANIEVLGRLSKNVSNVLGAAGNASLNTLLSTLTGNKIKEGARSQIVENVNKIPLIEISADDYRLFLAKIKGKLNSEDYVKSFNWLN